MMCCHIIMRSSCFMLGHFRQPCLPRSWRRWNSADPLQRRVICIFALAGRIRRAAAQRVYEIIHAVPAVIDGIATTAVGLALQQPQFTRQNRKIRDADRTAHKQRQRFEIQRGLVLVSTLIADAAILERRHRPFSRIAVTKRLAEPIILNKVA